MNYMDKIIVIGDSHVRSFSFNQNFIPMFIGPAAFNNFLTEKNTNTVISKLTELLLRIKLKPIKVLLLLSGDVIHVVRKSQGYSKEESIELNNSAKRYLDCITRIREHFPHVTLSVSAVLPGREELYSIYQDEYNKLLSDYCKSEDIHFININECITENKLLTYPYQADFAHISYRAIRFYIKNLKEKNLLTSKASEYSDYQWAYTYEFQTDSGPFRIWGGLYRDQLIKKEFEILPLKEFPKLSNDLAASISKIAELCINRLGVREFTVANCREGFLAYILQKKLEDYEVKINGFDLDSLKIENVEFLKCFKATYDIDLKYVSLEHIISDEYEFDYKEAVLDYCQYKFKEPIKTKLLSSYSKYTKYLFLLSKYVDTDIERLNTSGFTNVISLADIGRNYALLLATNECIDID